MTQSDREVNVRLFPWQLYVLFHCRTTVPHSESGPQHVLRILIYTDRLLSGDAAWAIVLSHRYFTVMYRALATEQLLPFNIGDGRGRGGEESHEVSRHRNDCIVAVICRRRGAVIYNAGSGEKESRL